MQIDPAVFAAVSSGLGFLGTAWTGWLAYRIRMKAFDTELAIARLHDCLDEHREDVKKATAKLETLATATHDMAENQLVMHGQNQVAIAGNQMTLETIATEVNHALEPVSPGGADHPGRSDP
jgi:hypothetical protein